MAISMSKVSICELVRKIRARYIGWVGRGNLGDEALYKAIGELFYDHLSFYAADEYRRHLDVQAVFLGGGTLIKSRAKSLKRLEKELGLHPQAKFIVFGTGVGDATMWEKFGYPIDIEWCRKMLEQAAYLAVRGPLSKKHLEDWGVKKEIHVIGDPAIWFAGDVIISKQKSKRIGVNLGPSRGLIHGQNEMYVLECATRLLRRLNDEGWQITIFPMIQDDVEYLNQAIQMAGISKVAIHKQFHDLSATLDMLEEQDVFIGEKLHSVILAHCVYTPAIMLEYRTKCRDYMLSMDLEEWTYRTDNLDADLIVKRLYQLYENSEQHQQHLFLQMQRWKNTLRVATDQVKTIIAGETGGVTE